MKRLERVVLLANPDKLDGCAGDLAYGKCRAAAGIPIHFGEDDTGQRQFLVELVGGLDRILSCHGISHKQDFRGTEQRF